MSVQQSFNLVKILFPSFEGAFLKDPGLNANFTQGFRINVNILSDSRAQIIFGLQLESEEKDPNNFPVVRCSIDAMAEIDFTAPLPTPVKDLSQIPLLANILAMLFPFMREKVNYFLSNNLLLLMIPPVNTFEIIKGITDQEGTARIQDLRVLKKAAIST